MLDTINFEEVNQIARAAGAAILEVYGTEFSVDSKEDDSPLTEADRRSNAVILEGLARLNPAIPIISEETRTLPYEERKDWNYFWLVDPLDGTKEFIKRNGEFTVNIALVRGQTPVLGVVYQPVGDHLYWAAEGRGAWKSSGGGAAIHLEGNRPRLITAHAQDEIDAVGRQYLSGFRPEKADCLIHRRLLEGQRSEGGLLQRLRQRRCGGREFGGSGSSGLFICDDRFADNDNAVLFRPCRSGDLTDGVEGIAQSCIAQIHAD